MAAWTPEEDATLRRLHATGKSLHAIAQEMSRSKGTISRKAADLGLTWDRAQVAKATEAHRVDARARRQAITTKLYDKAEQLLEQIDQPHIVFSIGGKDNVYTEHTLDRPPTGDIRNLMLSVTAALQRALDLEKYDGDGGVVEAVGMLDQIANAIKAAAETLR